MTANELLQAVDAPPMPDFHVRRDGETWFIQPLTHEARVYAEEFAGFVEFFGDRIVLRHFDGLVKFLDQLFDSGLRVV